MVKVKCPIPACEFETDDLDAAIVAALISTHAKVHDTVVTPAKAGKVSDPLCHQRAPARSGHTCISFPDGKITSTRQKSKTKNS